MQKTLVVHHPNGIGDLVWHIPYIRAIAKTSFNGKVTVLARPSCRAQDILAAEPCVDEVIEYDRKPRNKKKGTHDGFVGQIKFLLLLRKHRFDRIFIFSGRVRYAILAYLAGIPVRSGFGFWKFQRLFLNSPPYISPHKGTGSWVYPEASNFAIAQGFVESAIIPKMTIPKSLIEEASFAIKLLPHPRYALAIGASIRKKNWGNAQFFKLAHNLINKGGSVIFLGGPAERKEAEEFFSVRNGLPENYFYVMCQASVLQSAAMLKNCDYCVGNDTGILNVAVACDILSLGLFGATQPLTHDPLLFSLSGESMENISVKAVVDKLSTLTL